jgi:hypothetical protein
MCAAHKGVKNLPILAQGLPAVSLESLILNHQLIVSACPPIIVPYGIIYGGLAPKFLPFRFLFPLPLPFKLTKQYLS